MPLAHGNRGENRRIRRARPGVRQIAQADHLQPRVDQADLRVIDEREQQRNDGHGNQNRQEIHRAQHRAHVAQQLIFQHGRDAQRQPHLKDHRNHAIPDVVDDRGANHGIGQHFLVVGQPNERFRRRKRAEVLRRIEEIDHQRDIDENTQQQNARNHVEIRRSTVHASASSLLHNGHLLIEYRFAFTYTGLPFKGYAPLLKDNRSMVDLSPISRQLGEKKNRRPARQHGRRLGYIT